MGGTWRKDDRWRERDWGEYGTVNDATRDVLFKMSKQFPRSSEWYWVPTGGESLVTGVRLRFEDILDTAHRETDPGDPNSSWIVAAHGEIATVAMFVLERLTPGEFERRRVSGKYKMANGQVLHYTRRNPLTGEVADRLRWRRSVCPWDPTRSWDNGEWVEITEKLFSDEDLLARQIWEPTKTVVVRSTVFGKIKAWAHRLRKLARR